MKDRDVEPLGEQLKGKNIGLLITGGIAAYKTPSLIRHFRQYGANVIVYLTSEAKHYVTKRALEWASLNQVFFDLSADAEHLKQLDAYVIAPATYNTIGKIAKGIADNAVTSVMASALGRLEKGETKVLIAPSMHGTMQNSSIFKENVQELVSRGVKIIEPDYKWGKANLPKSHQIVVQTIRHLSESNLKGKNILITAGPTPGKIDNVRLLTSRFRGRTGIAIAEEAYMRGANVKLVLGSSGIPVPKFLDVVKIRNFEEYLENVMNILRDNKIDIGIFSAAVADYIPAEVREGKIPSQGALNSILLKETIKVIKKVRTEFPSLFMVTFKYEEGITRERLLEIAEERIRDGYQLVVANRGEEMNEKEHHSIIVSNKGIIAEPGSKQETGKMLSDILEKKIL